MQFAKMQFAKMQRVLNVITNDGVSGYIGTSAGSELTLYCNSQPTEVVHKHLLKVGFITNNSGEYIYRPPTKRK